MPRPIHEENGKWYFWDETWANKCGPYDSEEDAQIALDKYCRIELDGQPRWDHE